MKKIFTYLGLIAFSFGASAQIEIHLEGETANVSGTVVEFVAGDSDLDRVFDVKNLSGATINMQVVREKITELPGTEDYLCWGVSSSTGQCYPTGLVAPNNPWLAPHDFDIPTGVGAWLSVHHLPNGVSGCVEYKYVILGASNERLDSVNVKFCSTVGVDELEKVDISVYPNPASNLLNVSLENDVDDVNFTLFNILGDEVLSSTLNGGVNEVSVARLPNGVYFYSIIKENEVIETKKLIVRHN